MRSHLLSAAAAAVTIMALPALAHAQSVAAKTPCEITDPVAHGAARAQAPLAPVATYTSTVVAPDASIAATNTAAAEYAPPVVTPEPIAPAPATYTNQLITNGPVADTPENRAKYGQPMSNAGKRTAPVGN